MLQSSKFECLVNQHKNKIYNYSIYMVKNHMDAEDITQEVMIRTWQNINKFKFIAARAWIMRTTHNLCLDYLRRQGRKFKREVQIDDNLSNKIVDERSDVIPDEILNQNFIDSKIKNAVEILPGNLKSSFVLYELQGFKYKEISKILDIPLNSVKVNILRARKQLQKELTIYAREEITNN